jgi:WD40 repeat protein
MAVRSCQLVPLLSVLVLFLTETFFAQTQSSSASARQSAASVGRPSIASFCRGDDLDAPGTQRGEAAQPIIQSGHAGTITTMTFSPHNTLLTTGSQDGTVKLWSVRTGQLLRSLSVSSYWVYSVAFSPNGCTVAAGSGDHNIYRWDLDTNTQLPPVNAPASFRAVAFSPDGTLLTSGSAEVGTHPGSSGMANSDITTSSTDGKWMAFSSGPEIILRSNSGQGEKRLSSSESLGVSALQLSESGSLMGAGLRNGEISVWDKPSRATYRSLQASEYGLNQAIRTLGLDPAANTVFGASRTGGVIEWNLASSKPPRLTRKPAQGVRGDSLLETREELGLARPQPPRALQAWVDGVPQNPTGTEEILVSAIAVEGTIATGGLYFDPTITIGYVSLTKPGANRPAPRFTDGRRGDDDVTALAFSSDGRKLAVGFSGGGIDILSVLDQSIVARLDGHHAQINGLAFSPDGGLLASANSDKTVGLWNLKTSGPGQMLAGHESPVLCVSFSGEDDELLASAGADNKIILWNAKSGKLVHTLEGHSSAVNALAFVPGQKTLVSGGEDATVRFWNTSTFELLATLLPVRGSPDWLTTTPNGFFDGKEGTWGQVLWQFNRDLFDVSPVEIGFRDYFVPNLLAKVLGGQAPATPRSLATLNRVQPIVRILSVTPDSPKTVQVNVEVKGTTSKTHTDETGHGQTSGVYDLRIFRNRQLSGRWPDVAEGARPSPDQGLEAWRRLHSVPLQPDGKAVVSFHNIRVPQDGKMHKVDFTAYAFNSDRVKSLTSAPFQYVLPKSGAASTRRAYLVTVGVNANQSHNLSLDLAVSSAESVRTLLRVKLESEYPEVDEIPLYSDLDSDSDRVQSKTATKADLKAVLDLLAGVAVDQSLREEIDPKHRLKPASPDDAVVLYIASHGYADPQGTFYVMPYDTGSNWGIRCSLS